MNNFVNSVNKLTKFCNVVFITALFTRQSGRKSLLPYLKVKTI